MNAVVLWYVSGLFALKSAVIGLADEGKFNPKEISVVATNSPRVVRGTDRPVESASKLALFIESTGSI